MILSGTKTSCLLRLLHPFISSKNSTPMDKSRRMDQQPHKAISLDQLKKGETALVESLKTSHPKNLQKLLAMGIVPGRILRVIQRYPAFILQIDRTQAAMDRELAQMILVRK